jgi:hypothetical protein
MLARPNHIRLTFSAATFIETSDRTVIRSIRWRGIEHLSAAWTWSRYCFAAVTQNAATFRRTSRSAQWTIPCISLLTDFAYANVFHRRQYTCL